MQRYANLRGKALLFLFFLWFLWFINFITRMAFAPILPLVEDEFMVNHAQASSIFIFLSVGYGVAVIFSGLFSGRFGYKKSIVISLLFLSLVAFLIPLVHEFLLLYFFAFMLGISVGFYLPAVIPLITEYYSEKDWGKAIAIHDTGASCSIFATPFIALFLLRFFPWRGIFIVLACSYLVCSTIFWFVSTEVKVTNPPKAVFISIIKIRSLWLMSVIWIFSAGANLGIYSIVPLYLTKELHMDIGYANTILGISRLGAVVVAIACGFLIDRFNLRRIMFLVMIITSVLTVLMGLVSVRYIGIVLFLQAFFVTAFFPVGLVAMAKTFNREMRSLATGIIVAISIVFGGGIIPYLLGISGDMVSFRLGITILGIFVALSSTLIFHLKELE
jgi:MFS transporter, NNP family, nitrate/nitrite transporter